MKYDTVTTVRNMFEYKKTNAINVVVVVIVIVIDIVFVLLLLILMLYMWVIFSLLLL
jgi:hypothetical protein